MAAWVQYHRNVPTLVQLMLWYFGISSLLPDGLQIWLTEHNGESPSADHRARPVPGRLLQRGPALRPALDSRIGQTEAARALGHGYLASLRHVLMPQAFRNALPALVNHSVSLFKNSSLAMAIGVAELTHAAQGDREPELPTFETYLFATVLYLGSRC